MPFRHRGRLKRAIAALTAAVCGALAATRAQASTAQAPFAATLATLPAQPSLTSAAGWDGAATIPVAWDYTNGHASVEAATVQAALVGSDLFLRFSVPQHEAIVASQHVNDIGDGSDDEVTVYLWPSGQTGFRYQFSATPNGTHYQYSTENNVYSPTWTSRGIPRDGGYDVTMDIPLGALRGDGRATWNAQFTRINHASGETDEWSHAPNQATLTASVYAGSLTGFASAGKAAKPQPRIGVYGLGAIAAPSAGGSTSRMGADVSLPITPTSSFVAAIHPDFSNVEQDQQTISPTTFQRRFNEVRPFFSQSAANILSGNCSGCPNLLELYTPSIPTPRDGYALEGTQGPLTFGAFDAVGDHRSDTAETVNYVSPNRKLNAWETRVSADLPGVHDVTQLLTLSYDTLAHVNGYIEYGNDSGTNVSDRSQAQRYDAGVSYYTKDDFDAFTVRKIGQSYNPYDGLISQTDISGYSAQTNHTFHFGPTKRWQSATFSTFLDRYVGRTGGIDLSDQYVTFNATTRTQFTYFLQAGSQYDKAPGDTILRPFTQMTEGVQYQVNTALQSQLLYNFGAFGDGRLVFIQRDGAFKIARRATLSLNLDSTDWRGDGLRNVQWLERAGLTFDVGPRSSFSIGARKIVGTAPQFNTPQSFVNFTNLSLGFSKRLPHDEFYLVYGDASRLSTYPAAILKWIHYFGAEKGT